MAREGTEQISMMMRNRENSGGQKTPLHATFHVLEEVGTMQIGISYRQMWNREVQL